MRVAERPDRVIPLRQNPSLNCSCNEPGRVKRGQARAPSGKRRTVERNNITRFCRSTHMPGARNGGILGTGHDILYQGG
jgi:hypothetical protein